MGSNTTHDVALMTKIRILNTETTANIQESDRRNEIYRHGKLSMVQRWHISALLKSKKQHAYLHISW